VTVNDGKPSFEGYYTRREDYLRDDALKRYEALKPQVTEMKAELMVGWE
jgi:hypothetical protein